MLLQIKRTLNNTIAHLKNSVQNCLQIQLPGQIKKNMHTKLNNVKNGIVTIQDELKILMGSIHFIETKNNELTQQKIRTMKKHCGHELQNQLENQLQHLNKQMQMLKVKNQKLSKQMQFVKFSNQSLREQIRKISPYKSENQNMKTAMKSIQEELISDVNKISSKINRMIKSSNLDVYDQLNQPSPANKCARQKISRFNNRKLAHFQFQDILNLDITPPIQEIVQVTQKKRRICNDESANKRNINLLREIHYLQNESASTKKKARSSTKDRQHQHLNNKQRKQQYNTISKGISVKKSEELAKLVAEQTKIIQCKQRYLSTDLV